MKINIQGVQRKGTEAVESTKDDISSTKYDFKHVCHSFLRLVMANKQTHFNQLKDRLGFQGIAVMGLDKVGFNINLHIVCFNLGALETLVKSYESKRLRLIVQSCLVTDQYLNKLGVANLELSVSIEDRLINKNREVIVAHSSTNELKEHPIDSVSMCKYLMDDNETQDDRFEVKPGKRFPISSLSSEKSFACQYSKWVVIRIGRYFGSRCWSHWTVHLYVQNSI